MTDIDAQAKEVFFKALDRGSPERLTAYLQEACGEDVNLRRRVDDLLRAHQDGTHQIAQGPGNDQNAGPWHGTVPYDDRSPQYA